MVIALIIRLAIDLDSSRERMWVRVSPCLALKPRTENLAVLFLRKVLGPTGTISPDCSRSSRSFWEINIQLVGQAGSSKASITRNRAMELVAQTAGA